MKRFLAAKFAVTSAISSVPVNTNTENNQFISVTNQNKKAFFFSK